VTFPLWTSCPVGSSRSKSWGALHSVWSVGRQAAGWVEWRPFLFESLSASFPDGRFKLCRTGSSESIVEGPLESYLEILENEAFDLAYENGDVSLDARFVVPRVSVARTLLTIATIVERLHKAGEIHGDLKASNVLLTANQPTLIDEFGLQVGEIAPGWTPDWSPPEQVLGNPVTPAADIYPLGIMLLRLLGGRLVGEVRKFRTVPDIDGRDEFDIFYDPFVHVPDKAVVSAGGLRDWLGFTRTCLAFNPESRIESAAEFVSELRSLLEEYPLRGDLTVTVLTKLIVARLPDGSQRVVRLLDDAHPGAASPDRGPFSRPMTQVL
jgi:serine/threonine protein kinase